MSFRKSPGAPPNSSCRSRYSSLIAVATHVEGGSGPPPVGQATQRVPNWAGALGRRAEMRAWAQLIGTARAAQRANARNSTGPGAGWEPGAGHQPGGGGQQCGMNPDPKEEGVFMLWTQRFIASSLNLHARLQLRDRGEEIVGTLFFEDRSQNVIENKESKPRSPRTKPECC